MTKRLERHLQLLAESDKVRERAQIVRAEAQEAKIDAQATRADSRALRSRILAAQRPA
jgi:hypothetical protein